MRKDPLQLRAIGLQLGIENDSALAQKSRGMHGGAGVLAGEQLTVACGEGGKELDTNRCARNRRKAAWPANHRTACRGMKHRKFLRAYNGTQMMRFAPYRGSW